ncbi:transcription elongation factor GreA [Mesoplasma lactucae]|uniref:Transcription elongation factor GreA n=1 Tax=Mesoplasma lactucae ATCC 49193 TaxID=81460 RepID=A0A291IR91_9MOLU|nr:transcription elongation factor GreA [Mesoplasma lactucae]ATG97254.1 transcription elongation factor GreA [Mesoplasma lactucae ATCC 49193]ATZ20298.1 transcription elongation factor GreA [Mesoplasma lactucae ATCC 49193]MCL8216469.1 Transcription elongation factor GreA [Mesoplasma lactucae ATCC 49193]
MADNNIILTKEGLEEKRKELRRLIDVVRPQVIEELVEARNQGDLSENADYDAARNKQAEVEAKIKSLEAMISKAQVIENNGKKGEIKVGSQVTYTNVKTKQEHTVKIVGGVEADPFKGLISNESPLAKAMLGHKVDETVEVRDVTNPYKIKITQVK